MRAPAAPQALYRGGCQICDVRKNIQFKKGNRSLRVTPNHGDRTDGRISDGNRADRVRAGQKHIRDPPAIRQNSQPGWIGDGGLHERGALAHRRDNKRAVR
jgi:hypothetical protein